jgi:hypothetical protein
MKLKIYIQLYLAIICFSIIFKLAETQCHNNCNKNGVCDEWSRCRCFGGWEGNDCGTRSCPKGVLLGDTANGWIDQAHTMATCSGRGVCIGSSGICKCNEGYFGLDCGSSYCPNNCNNHGSCMSLRHAAETYDGYLLNHTTSYNLWDADTFFGCKCDPGWSGYDCSQRSCGVGADPRLSSLAHETVLLVCECAPNCAGIMKLRMMGSAVNAWFRPSTTANELAAALMTIPSIIHNIYLTTFYYYSPNKAYQSICRYIWSSR